MSLPWYGFLERFSESGARQLKEIRAGQDCQGDAQPARMRLVMRRG